MGEEGRCERCGNKLPKEGFMSGGCPRCMLELGYETGAESAKIAATGLLPVSIGRYRILRVIGEGGMGIVYEAEQDQPRRIVALKIIKPGMASPELLRRFEQETEALGRLQHSGIAQIYEAGTLDTGFGLQPYFAMEFIRGLSPRDHAEAHRLNTRERLEIMAKICESVQHAHQRGLIHRDLKPANILVDETGQPKVLDFGVARVTDSDARATLQTDLGQLVGTLAYMSPEQVLADPFDIDTRSDVYALGVVLYELLVGRLPYTIGKKIPENILAIREKDPARLSAIDRIYRGDIETIVGKALEKDRTRRYASAAELATDIRRYLSDQPIIARPPTAAYQLKKFARRNRALVVGASVVFTVLIVGVIVSTWQAARAMRAEQYALLERDRAVQAEAMAGQERDRAAAAEVLATGQRNVAIEAEQRASSERDRAIVAETQVREDRDRITWQNMSRESVRLSGARTDDDLAALLARQAHLFERRVPHPSQSSLVETALQQASRATSWSHNILQGYETEVRALAFSPDGAYLATNGSDGSIAMWDLRRPASPPRFLKGQPGLGPVLFIAFSPDGTRLATGGFESSGARGNALAAAPVKIWDLREPNPSPTLLQGHQREVTGGIFSPDGKYLATTDSQAIRLWDLQSRVNQSVVLQPQQPGVFAIAVAYSPDGERLASTDNDGVHLWDLRTPSGPNTLLPGSQGALRVAFSPDGTRLALGARDGVRLWDLQNPGAPPRVMLQGPQSSAVTFSLDGSRLASGSTDGVVRIWELVNLSAQPLQLRGHQGAVVSVAFSPEGSRLASGGNDKTVRIWELQSSGAPLVLLPADRTGPLGGKSQFVVFSPDGNRLFAGRQDSSVRMWELQNASAPSVLVQGNKGQAAQNISRQVAFSRDGAFVAIGNDEDTRILDLRNPSTSPVVLPVREPGPVRSLMLSPSGSQLAQTNRATGTIGKVWLWDLRNFSTQSLSFPASPQIVTKLAYSPDGSRLATANQQDVRIWDLQNPGAMPLLLTQRQPRPVSSLAFSPDGALLAVGAEDTLVWNLLKSTTPPSLLRGFPGFGVEALEFSPDGKHLASGNLSGITQLWDLRNLTAAPVSLQTGGVASLAFSPDGHHLVIGGGDGDGGVRLWTLGSAAADYLCTRVWRNLSIDEWRIYAGEGIPYERTCPALPAGAGVSGTQK